MAGGRAVETSPIFVFRMTFYVHRRSGQAHVYPRRWLSLSSRAKAFTLKGRHRRFVGDPAFHRSLRGAPLLVGEQKKWYQQILQKVQNLVPHDYIKSCTVCIYCCTAVCRVLCTNDLIVFHPLGIFSFSFSFFSEKNPVCRDRTHGPTCQKVTWLPLSYWGDRLVGVLNLHLDNTAVQKILSDRML